MEREKHYRSAARFRGVSSVEELRAPRSATTTFVIPAAPSSFVPHLRRCCPTFVIPAEAGIQWRGAPCELLNAGLDPSFRWDDEKGELG
jgi:hypothetical protein